jgi:hypothetical protein
VIVLKDFANGVYKLGPAGDPGGLMGRVLSRAEMTPDLSRMACDLVLTKEIEDRSGDVVAVAGIQLDDHVRHPIALLNHDQKAPIGRFADAGGNYTVRATGDTLRGTLYFHQGSQFAHDVFQAVVDKVFTGASIGFLPVAGAVTKRHPRGTNYGKCKLVEGSIVTIGDNPHAGVEAVHKALARPGVSDAFRQHLLPLVPDRRPVVVSGFEGWSLDSDATFKDAKIKPGDFREFVSPVSGDGGIISPREYAKLGANAANPDGADDDADTAPEDEFLTDGDEADTWAERVRQFLKKVARAEKFANLAGSAQALLDEDGEGDDEPDDPDLTDESIEQAEQAEKAFTANYAKTLSVIADGLVNIASTADPDPEKVAAFAGHLATKMATLPTLGSVVRKAISDSRDWAAWQGGFDDARWGDRFTTK